METTFNIGEGEYTVRELTRAEALRFAAGVKQLPPEVLASDAQTQVMLEALFVTFCHVTRTNDKGYAVPKTVQAFEELPASVAEAFAREVIKANRDAYLLIWDFLREARTANGNNATRSAPTPTS